MRRSRRGGVCVGVGALVAAASLVLAGVGAQARADSTHMVPAVLAGLPLATLDGPAAASQMIGIGVSLARPDTTAEIALYDQLYNPSSREYQQFLTPAQFDQQFGVPTAQASAVENWLEAGGLSIETTSPAGDYFTAQGTVAQLDSLFGVAIGDYSYDGQDFYANNVPPTVPTDLPIDAVIGLDNVRQFSLGSLTSTMPSTDGHTQTQSGTEGVLTPQDLWGVYDDPGAAALTNTDGTSTPTTLESTHTDVGQGETMGIFGEGETSSVVAQLRLFEHAMGLPKVPVRVVETEGGPDSAYGDNSGAVEWYLDSQSSTGMAPDVSQLDFYFAKSLACPLRPARGAVVPSA